MSKSRTEYAVKNFIWAIVGNVSNTLLTFISRTVFINILGTTYLGVNGLFTNILGILSLAELGIGAAISFSLYKPLADKDTKKIQAIINFYKYAYRVVALVVGVIGVCIIPFLRYIINTDVKINHISFIYCIFLFNTVTSYLITYKVTVLMADQRNYLVTNINTVVNLIASVMQVVILLLTHSFIVYLISGAVIQLGSKLYLNYFTNKMYPYLKGKNSEKLTHNEKNVIYTKVKALLFHKIGEVSIYQTDNIITSTFISTNAVGLVSNFVIIINAVNTFVMAFFSSAVAGLGNAIVTESQERKIVIFKRYDFLGFVFFGWSTVCLYFLLPPFITLWIGADKLVDVTTILLLCINYYFSGMRVPCGHIKTVAGVFEQDKWIPIIQSIVNIIVSIIGANLWGLKGIYIGTLVSSIIPNLTRPYIVYKYVLKVSSKQYFIQYIKRLMSVMACLGTVQILVNIMDVQNIFVSFMTKAILCFIVPFLFIMVLFYKTPEFDYIKEVIRKVKKKICKY